MKSILVESRPSKAVKVADLAEDAVIGYSTRGSLMLSVIVSAHYAFFNTSDLGATIATDAISAPEAVQKMERHYSGQILEWFVFDSAKEAIQYAAQFRPKS